MSSEESNITSEPLLPTTSSLVNIVVGSPNNNYSYMSSYDTELTLGLPGGGEFRKSAAAANNKRSRFSDIIVDLKLGSNNHDQQVINDTTTEHSVVTKVPLPVLKQEHEVIGWPPVRSCRKNMTMKKKKNTADCKYVKVAVDGAPYLRKIDIESYQGYHQLLCAFQHMFSHCFTIRNNVLKEMTLMDPINGIEYVPTYEDKDGDWMLAGDVPWEMFVESCKRIRLMKSSEAINGLDVFQQMQEVSITNIKYPLNKQGERDAVVSTDEPRSTVGASVRLNNSAGASLQSSTAFGFLFFVSKTLTMNIAVVTCPPSFN